MTGVRHLRGVTYHGRKGALQNRFRYAVDYVLADPETDSGPTLFSINRGNVMALHDNDHGGAPGKGKGVAWVRDVLAAHDLPGAGKIQLLAQPRVFGHVFNPVSFWLCHDGNGCLRVVIAEVSNTYGDRHSYLCHREDAAPITADDTLAARKLLHVSPFQPVAGDYAFRFDVRTDRIGIWIDYTTTTGGLYTNLTGPLQPLTNGAILRMCLRRPFGSRRVLALIHWQAARLALKGAPFRKRPGPPGKDVTR